MTFAETHNDLHPKQHGYRKNHGCEKQLIELVSDIAHNLDQGEEIEACVLDFSKAFDKVNHFIRTAKDWNELPASSSLLRPPSV